MIKEGERMRILVVEDELHLSEALSHILKKNNYEWLLLEDLLLAISFFSFTIVCGVHYIIRFDRSQQYCYPEKQRKKSAEKGGKEDAGEKMSV